MAVLWNFDELCGYSINARDGSLGRVDDLLFDDASWTMRYFVVDTAWLFGRRVLLSPAAVGIPQKDDKTVPVMLTKQQVEDSPSVDTDAPVSRQEEKALQRHYGWPEYWLYPSSMAIAGIGEDAVGAGALGQAVDAETVSAQGDPNLRSAKEICGYTVQAKDGDIGQVESFVIEDDSWVLRYVIIDTGNWWPGRKIVISPRWATDIDWAGRNFAVRMTKDQIASSPEYDPSAMIERSYETLLHDYYDVPPYWGR